MSFPLHKNMLHMCVLNDRLKLYYAPTFLLHKNLYVFFLFPFISVFNLSVLGTHE